MNLISQLRKKYPLKLLLHISKISESTFYYTLKKEDKDLKNDLIMSEIIDIFYAHKERYGYRRITLELKNRGYGINHKKVQRLMNKMNLSSQLRKKRNYSSYKGQVGKIADNFIKREFKAIKPNEKWYTDVTEFKLRGERVYLSSIIDGYNQEIVAHYVSKSPDLKQIYQMLEIAFENKPNLDGLILHSDQGWQYQHASYQKLLKERGIKQSMSRKGNSIDNGLMEGFFGLLKSEMFYGFEHQFQSLDELILEIDLYINYYNQQRIKVKLKGLSPVQYRLQTVS